MRWQTSINQPIFKKKSITKDMNHCVAFGLAAALVGATAMNADVGAQGIDGIISSLRDLECFEAKALFRVSLPQSDDDVVYDIDLSAAADSSLNRLSPCSYLTEWRLATPSGIVDGFSAYFDGHHYRYRNERLQEYHLAWDSIPFMPPDGSPGVQSSAQFTDLYPGFIADALAEMQSDPRFTLSIDNLRNIGGHLTVELRAVMKIDDITAMERRFVFDRSTLLPLLIETESNPGQISEQTTSVCYTYPDSTSMRCPSLSEVALIARHPLVFERYRESNFRIESLAGMQLPSFSLPTVDGNRFSHHRGEPLPSPTVIAILDPTTGFNADLIAAIRTAADRLPVATDILWAFNSTNTDLVNESIPTLRPDEHLLFNAKSLVSDCGAASLPVIVIADTSGTIKKVILGFNNRLTEIVMQSIALAM